MSSNSPKQTKTGLLAKVRLNNLGLYGSLSNSSSTYNWEKTEIGLLQKAQKLQRKPFGTNVDGGKNEKSWDDICFTPKWVCSHAVNSIHPHPPSDGLGAAHPVCCHSYWPSWHNGPSEVLPRLGTHKPQAKGHMLVREFGGIEVQRGRRREGGMKREECRILKAKEEDRRRKKCKNAQKEDAIRKRESLKVLSVYLKWNDWKSSAVSLQLTTLSNSCL